MFINKNEHMDEAHEQELFISINHFKTSSLSLYLLLLLFFCRVFESFLFEFHVFSLDDESKSGFMKSRAI